MDEQHVELIRDTIKQGFDNTNAKLDDLACAFQRHTEKDEGYWRKIDEQHAQIRLVKAVGGTGLFASLVAWLWQKFSH